MCEKAMHHTSQVGSESRPSEQGHDLYSAGSAESALRAPREKPGAAADTGTVECPGAHDDIPAGQPKAPAEYCPKDHLLTIHEVADLLSVPVSWVSGRTRRRCAGASSENRSRRKTMRSSQRKGKTGTSALSGWQFVCSGKTQGLGGAVEGRCDPGGRLSAPHAAQPRAWTRCCSLPARSPLASAKTSRRNQPRPASPQAASHF